MERPHGEWNVLEMVVEDKVIRQYVNGKLANVGDGSASDGGEDFVSVGGGGDLLRGLEIVPLK